MELKMSHVVPPSSIPVDAYLEYALSLTLREKEHIKEFSKWLPNKIIDSHVHSNTRSHCKFLNEYYFHVPDSTFPWFEISKHIKVNHVLYPTSKVRMLIFPMPYRGINHKVANDYILYQTTKNSTITPILYGIPDDTEYTISMLQKKRFYGLKMYRAYFSPPAQKIKEYFPDQILKHCEEIDIPIILHLPRSLPECIDELLVITKKFPSLRIVLAHLGLVFLPLKNLKKTFLRLNRYESVYLDTAMVTSAKVFKMAFDILGYHRIIFGTDQPLNLIRGKMYKNPTLGVRIATEYSYHWADPKEQKEFSQYATNSVHFHWEILLALKKAVQSYGENKNIKNSIFRENAKRVFALN